MLKKAVWHNQNEREKHNFLQFYICDRDRVLKRGSTCLTRNVPIPEKKKNFP